jgi:hypothetical protein
MLLPCRIQNNVSEFLCLAGAMLLFYKKRQSPRHSSLEMGHQMK